MVIRGAPSALGRAAIEIAAHAGAHVIASTRNPDRFSFFGSFMFGTPGFPTSEIPMQLIVDRVECGLYKAKVARILRFEEIREAHCLMEANTANGKIVVRV
ncbi:zinc-binding dehydrogenase [Burkholderia cenocepacia]|uniref:zinc-binding dehydrogenase n=1 Tax=Burkholderia cenocepacia TaxID=95486 RepID=UPI001F49307F|nr:zinc-binding dehydrogenase [Burkholderia cenocepacia]